jgi:hypothetical protein
VFCAHCAAEGPWTIHHIIELEWTDRESRNPSTSTLTKKRKHFIGGSQKLKYKKIGNVCLLSVQIYFRFNEQRASEGAQVSAPAESVAATHKKPPHFKLFSSSLI